MDTETEVEQKALFDLTGREFNINWVDEKNPLFIPNNPLHWKGHKLQILVGRLDKQAVNNPSQFNSRNYIDAINELEKVMIKINEGETNDVLDEGEVATVRDSTTAPVDGEVKPISMDS